MQGLIRTRFHQGHRTMSYPAGPVPALPARFAGRPILDEKKCPQGCHACADACPTGAILLNDGAYRLSLDTGRCLFCRACVKACPHQAICFSGEHRLAAARRQDLVVRPGQPVVPPALNGKVRKLFGRSLKLREVSAAGCNACEADINVLGTVAWDLGRFGIQVVAAPRHADGLVITGPVSQNMRVALQKTYEAVPEPKIVIAVGSCAISGGLFADHPETCNGAERITPVDLYIPGCPPHPLTILDGLLRFVGIIAAG